MGPDREMAHTEAPVTPECLNGVANSKKATSFRSKSLKKRHTDLENEGHYPKGRKLNGNPGTALVKKKKLNGKGKDNSVAQLSYEISD